MIVIHTTSNTKHFNKTYYTSFTRMTQGYRYRSFILDISWIIAGIGAGHTLIERNMRKEDLRLAAGLTTNMIANMGKEGKHISMDTLARICETLDCGIMDVPCRPGRQRKDGDC